MLRLYIWWASNEFMSSSATLNIHKEKTKGWEIWCTLQQWQEHRLTPADSHGLVNWAGEVLGAEAGQDVYRYFRQEGHQFDLKPELDEVWVIQVVLGQRWKLLLVKNLLNVKRQLSEVLQEEKETLINNHKELCYKGDSWVLPENLNFFFHIGSSVCLWLNAECYMYILVAITFGNQFLTFTAYSKIIK